MLFVVQKEFLCYLYLRITQKGSSKLEFSGQQLNSGEFGGAAVTSSEEPETRFSDAGADMADALVVALAPSGDELSSVDRGCVQCSQKRQTDLAAMGMTAETELPDKIFLFFGNGIGIMRQGDDQALAVAQAAAGAPIWFAEAEVIQSKEHRTPVTGIPALIDQAAEAILLITSAPEIMIEPIDDAFPIPSYGNLTTSSRQTCQPAPGGRGIFEKGVQISAEKKPVRRLVLDAFTENLVAFRLIAGPMQIADQQQ